MRRLLWYLILLPGCASCRPKMVETQVWTDIPTSATNTDTGSPDQPIHVYLAYRMVW